MTTFIAVHGGNRETPRMARRAGWEYGTRNNYTVYGDVYMTDFDPHNDTQAAWQQYLSDLKRLRPALALSIDFVHRDQWQQSDQRIADLHELGITALVAAKCDDAIRLTPVSFCGREVRIAFSVPTSYPPGDDDKYLPSPDVVRKNTHTCQQPLSVHLLGGHPDQWLWIKRQYGNLIRIKSIDGNALIREARRGKWWSAKHGKYIDYRNRGYSTSAIAILSMRNARRYLNSRVAVIRHGVRVRRCGLASGLIPTLPTSTQRRLF